MKINGNDIRLNEPYETRGGRVAIITTFNSVNSYYKFTGLVDGELIHWFENGNILESKNPHNLDIINVDKYSKPMKAETRPHKHADLIAKLAEMLKTDHEACKKLQYYTKADGEWNELNYDHMPDEEFEYRFAPETVIINGMECPKAVREPLKEGQHFFTPELYDSEMHNQYRWRGCDADRKWMRLGLIYLTKEDAITVAEALIKQLTEIK